MAPRVVIPFRHSHKLKPYAEAVERAGAEVIASDVSAPVSLNSASGLLLMGGTDVNPALYHAGRWPETEDPDDARDRAELELIEEALNRDLPILAICRGLQLLNVYHGGTLWQHLSAAQRHDVDGADKGRPAHPVLIHEGSLLSEIAGVPRWQVNSRHHQAANKVGEGLEVTARDADDGTIEALERKDRRWVVAVQWHPEDQARSDPEQQRLFDAFVQALE